MTPKMPNANPYSIRLDLRLLDGYEVLLGPDPTDRRDPTLPNKYPSVTKIAGAGGGI